ncbi:hypothetical protein CA234_22645 [Sphingomonas sp. ABOLE]|uniref:hypothetical protein n=1 Tax=Sphingomonas sp. ABOLE TaxID=1985878 RepID=UPI000F7DCB90|nr:hypothetical protein [Sphingomonas sp. ABOLE]RSV33357.1 hypothetical protein CA234_22645 [Sphingomonas sp. ABOLE]
MPETKPTTTDDIRNLLAHLLAGAAGEDEAHWLKLIGPVTALPIIDAPRSNWRVEPKGKPNELEAIEKAAEVVRLAYPYVPSPKSHDAGR